MGFVPTLSPSACQSAFEIRMDRIPRGCCEHCHATILRLLQGLGTVPNGLHAHSSSSSLQLQVLDVSALSHVCLVCCLSSVALCLSGWCGWGSPRHPGCGSGLIRVSWVTWVSSPTRKMSPPHLTTPAAATNAVLITLSRILRMSNCCR